MPSNNVNVALKLSMYNVCKNHYPIFIIMHIFSYAIQTLGLFNCFIFRFNLLLFFLSCAPLSLALPLSRSWQ